MFILRLPVITVPDDWRRRANSTRTKSVNATKSACFVHYEQWAVRRRCVSYACLCLSNAVPIQILRLKRLDHYLSARHQTHLLNALRPLISASATAKHSSSLSFEHRLVGVEELNPTLEILSNGVQVIDDDLRRLDNENVAQRNALTALMRDSSTVKLSIEEQTQCQDQMASQREMMTNEFQSMNESLKQMNLVSRDGTFLWRIEHVAQKIGQ